MYDKENRIISDIHKKIIAPNVPKAVGNEVATRSDGLDFSVPKANVYGTGEDIRTGGVRTSSEAEVNL